MFYFYFCFLRSPIPCHIALIPNSLSTLLPPSTLQLCYLLEIRVKVTSSRKLSPGKCILPFTKTVISGPPHQSWTSNFNSTLIGSGGSACCSTLFHPWLLEGVQRVYRSSLNVMISRSQVWGYTSFPSLVQMDIQLPTIHVSFSHFLWGSKSSEGTTLNNSTTQPLLNLGAKRKDVNGGCWVKHGGEAPYFWLSLLPLVFVGTGNDDCSTISLPWDLEDWSSCNKGGWARRRGDWIPHDWMRPPFWSWVVCCVSGKFPSEKQNH